jgi:hypothetical protein
LLPPSINWDGAGIFIGAVSSTVPVSFSSYPSRTTNQIQGSFDSGSGSYGALGMALYAYPFNITVPIDSFVANVSIPSANTTSGTIVNDCLYAFGNKK